jgi:hypothetical protein
MAICVLAFTKPQQIQLTIRIIGREESANDFIKLLLLVDSVHENALDIFIYVGWIRF